MNIAFVYQFFQDENQPGHSLSLKIVKYLSTKGHNLTVYRSDSGYMQNNHNKASFLKRLFKRNKFNSIEYIYTYAYANKNKGKFFRLWSHLSFSISSFLAILFTKKPDVAIVSSPPLFSSFSSCFIYWIFGIRYILEVRDLWPDSLVELEVIQNKFILKIMYWMEYFIYDKSSGIVSLTKGIQDAIIKKGWSDKKHYFIHCGVDFNTIYPDPEAGKSIRKKYNLINKKVILYFGAIGLSNNLETLIKSAKKLKNNSEIEFIIVGDGIYKNKLEKQISDFNLKNVRLLPAVEKKFARYYINAADICIVNLLDIPVFSGAIPTKLIDYMACGKPVLSGVRGEAKKILEDSNCGYFFEPNDHNMLTEKIIKILSQKTKAKKMGKRAFYKARSDFSIELMNQKMENAIFDSLTSSST